jgi:hypothetical protein
MKKGKEILEINPDKREEAFIGMMKLLEKKKRTDKEECKLHILCMLLTGMTVGQLNKLVKSILKKIPKDVKMSDNELIEYEINQIMDKMVVIEKKKKGDYVEPTHRHDCHGGDY